MIMSWTSSSLYYKNSFIDILHSPWYEFLVFTIYYKRIKRAGPRMPIKPESSPKE